MLESVFNLPARIQALRENPLGASFDSFSQALCDVRYVRSTAKRFIRAAEHFIYWVDRKGIPISSLNEAAVECFDHHLTQCRCVGYGRSYRLASLRGARRFLVHLRTSGMLTTPAVTEPADPTLMVAFQRWMRQQRGTCDGTLQLYRRPILDLLLDLGEDPAGFDAQGLRQFVLRRSERGAGAVQHCATALRAFCRFLSSEGRCSRDLAAAIPSIASWRQSSLPRYLPPEDVERVIAASKIDSPVGRRNRAILLLLARLGLRAGDIVQLRLTDIDWKGAWIQVSGKSRRHARLPLTQELGEALAEYLQEGRPATEATAVFVRASAPFRALKTHNSVTHIVDRAFHRAGVIRPSRGAAHLLRHYVSDLTISRSGVKPLIVWQARVIDSI